MAAPWCFFVPLEHARSPAVGPACRCLDRGFCAIVQGPAGIVGPVAQWIEHLIPNQGVAGSNPAGVASKINVLSPLIMRHWGSGKRQVSVQFGDFQAAKRGLAQSGMASLRCGWLRA